MFPYAAKVRVEPYADDVSPGFGAIKKSLPVEELNVSICLVSATPSDVAAVILVLVFRAVAPEFVVHAG